MKSLTVLYFVAMLALASCPVWGNDDPAVETLICFRHGEKPPGGYGQLDIRGLNRSLALPNVLLSKYGKPQYIFAPDPREKVRDEAGDFYYVRPLATVEPTAIKCGMPVETPFGFTDTRALQKELLQSKYQGATVFVAWEHDNLEIFSKRLMAELKGDVRQLPRWHGDDYDYIYVFRISSHGGGREISFTFDHEGLNGLSQNYP
jgi:hypothetical protein